MSLTDQNALAAIQCDLDAVAYKLSQLADGSVETWVHDIMTRELWSYCSRVEEKLAFTKELLARQEATSKLAGAKLRRALDARALHQLLLTTSRFIEPEFLQLLRKLENGEDATWRQDNEPRA